VNPRILFVDDERAVLDGLRNVLRRKRGSWDMVFVPGGAAGLAELDQQRFDIVVSDMRMPGMDGSTFLRQVKAKFPETARVILSGQAERSALLGALGTAQVYLSKPCPTDMLVQTLEQCLGIREIVTSEPLRKIVGRMDRIASPPGMYEGLVALATGGAPAADIAHAVGRDLGASVKLLQIVNSAYFGAPDPVLSVDRAVSFLGVEVVRAIVLGSDAFARGSEERVTGAVELEEVAFATARLARRMTPDPRSAEAVFMGALLHDIGGLVLGANYPAESARAHARSHGGARPLHECEREEIGASHAAVGGYLLGVWGLPMAVVACATRHHELPRVTPNADLLLVHIADALVHEALGRQNEAPLDEASVHGAGLGPKLGPWRVLAEQEIGGRIAV
jgi:HD-like signal output (HDOD) protein/CheY-like chemotaxis protein